MSKAFDSLNHNILLLKLQGIGLSPAALNCMVFELFVQQISSCPYKFRTFRQTTDSKWSTTRKHPRAHPVQYLCTSVPQCCKSKLYVNDNKLCITFPVQQCPSVLEDMNKDLTKVRNWCFDNFLLLDAYKTKLMLFGSRQMIAKIPNFNLSLLGKDLVPTRCARDLGVIFDDQLTFSDHAAKTVSSCMSSLTKINRAKHAFDKDLLVTIIKGLVFSKMFYCSSVWSNTSVTNINKLQAIQNFAARIVTRSRKIRP